MENTKILIVDDDASQRSLLKLLFESYGYKNLYLASNGKIAVEKYLDLSEKIDVVLMDYRMPIMNGLEATKKILEINALASIVILSADDISKEAIEYGAKFFIKKPFMNISAIIDVIKKLCFSKH